MRLSGSGVSIDLRPVRYQFPDLAAGDWHDLNWLVIAGEVESLDGSWTFVDACLLTREAAQLGRWLSDAAHGLVAPSQANAEGWISPSCDFTEPNLAFSVEGREGGDVVIRVHFSLESEPPWCGEDVEMFQFFLQCGLSGQALLSASEQWLGELIAFPERSEGKRQGQ